MRIGVPWVNRIGAGSDKGDLGVCKEQKSFRFPAHADGYGE